MTQEFENQAIKDKIIIEDRFSDVEYWYRGEYDGNEFIVMANPEYASVRWDDESKGNEELDKLILEKYYEKW